MNSNKKQPFQSLPSNPCFPAIEEEILNSWKEQNTFERSVENRDVKHSFVFYDGPPFATGLPHFGHLLQGTVKDLVPRYKTMRGNRVERRFGWDCHGLPIELEIEKTLNLNGRPEILDFGVARYNEECRSTVLRYTKEWQVVTERLGRWIDFDNDYKTMDRSYMESVWHVFKRLWDEGLIYEGRKVLPYSWRLATPLSNSEASLNYMDVQDPSVTVRFRLKGEQNRSLLVWTTTPWTLVSNLGVCAHPDMKYVEIETLPDGERLILSESLLQSYFKEGEYTLVKSFLGLEMKGWEYEPLFDYASQHHDTSQCYRVLNDTYVTDDSGTGLVHQAPAFGEDDLRICQPLGIPVFDPLDESGNFQSWMDKFGGMNFKEADKHICRDLKDRGLMFLHQTVVHNYPFCWRTDTPLMYKAMPAWFVDIEKIKQRLLKNAEEIHWVPEHIKDGRFGKWLENAKDWAISRSRFWGCPLPVWINEDGESICFGSVEELEKASGTEIEDIHKHFVDEIVFERDGKKYHRVPEVLDCWFESGSMPYGQQHYPFEKQKEFEEHFPADFICEAIDQTRCWFYYLHVIATALFDRPAFRNVICTGLILAADGKKLSKRHKNYTPPMEVFHTYGADA
ncbi:isoleucine--tRNA ligase, partial [bacterium]|nr:isoleucine--tRNA ligase [bacterium]